MADLKRMLRKRRAFHLNLWTFLFINLAANLAFIWIFYRAELGKSPIASYESGWLVLFVNLLLLLLYLKGGRKTMSAIPLIAVWTTVLTAGVGLFLTHPAYSLPLILDFAYRVAQLFVGESAWIDAILAGLGGDSAKNTITALFHTARVTALIATISVVLTLLRRLTDWFHVASRVCGSKTVLCGLGEAGIEFVQHYSETIANHGNSEIGPLLIIEYDETNPNIETARDLGVAVLVGDVFSPVVQDKARIDRATNIILMLPDDKRNIELALEIRNRIENSKRSIWNILCWRNWGKKKPTKLLIHVDDTRLARRLQDHSRAGVEECTETRFFDFYESSARALFEKHPLDRYAETQRSEVAHLAIYGFGQMGDAVLRQAVRQASLPDGRGLHVSIFDRRVGEGDFVAGFWRANPGLKRLQESDQGYKPMRFSLRFLKLTDAHCGIGLERLYGCIADGIPPPTQHVICFDTDALGAGFAMTLRDTLRGREPLEIEGRNYSWDAPIFVRLHRRHGLARLFLESESGAEGETETVLETPDSLFAFGMLDDVVEPRELIGAHRDDLARILHNDGYRKIRRLHGSAAARNIWRKQTNVAWEHLPLHYKSSSRAQADHIQIKLRSVRCTVAEPSIPVPEASLSTPGAACFEPIDRIFVDGKTVIAVQRIHTKLPIVTRWTPRKIDDKDEFVPDQTPRNAGKLDDWAEARGDSSGKWLPREWRKAVKTIKRLEQTSGLPELIGPKDPLINRDASNKVEIKTQKGSSKDRALQLSVRDKTVAFLEVDSIRNPEVGETRDAWPWIGAIIKGDNANHDAKQFLVVWKAEYRKTSIPYAHRQVLDLPDAKCENLKAEYKISASADGELFAVLSWWAGKPKSDDRKAETDTQRLTEFRIWFTDDSRMRSIEVPSEIDCRYEPVAFKFSSNGKFLLLALQWPVFKDTDDDDKESDVRILYWSTDEANVTPDTMRGVTRKSIGNICEVELGEGDDKEIKVFAATSENRLVVLDGSNQVHEMNVTIHSQVTALSQIGPSTLAVGCSDSDLLLVKIDANAFKKTSSEEQGCSGTITQLSSPWLRHLRDLGNELREQISHTAPESIWENLSRNEHDRWSAFNYLENWRYGKPRVDIARIHDNLIPWERLSGTVRQYDSIHVAKIPLFLDRLGRQQGSRTPKQLCKEIRIGIVGHRPHRLTGHLDWLNRKIEKDDHLPSGKGMEHDNIVNLVLGLQKAFSVEQKPFSVKHNDLPIKFVLVSCLAEGADRVLAEALLENEALNAEMDVLLPLPWEIYANTFGNEGDADNVPEARKQSVEQFLRLIRHKRTRQHVQLPLLQGSAAAVDSDKSEPGKANVQQKQFQLANAWIAQHCDCLIAAWDGRELNAGVSESSNEDAPTEIRHLLNAEEEAPYSADCQPGGTWEAVRWWIYPETIPGKMRWSVGYRTQQSSGQSDRKKHLQSLGFDIANHMPEPPEKQ